MPATHQKYIFLWRSPVNSNRTPSTSPVFTSGFSASFSSPAFFSHPVMNILRSAIHKNILIINFFNALTPKSSYYRILRRSPWLLFRSWQLSARLLLLNTKTEIISRSSARLSIRFPTIRAAIPTTAHKIPSMIYSINNLFNIFLIHLFPPLL